MQKIKKFTAFFALFIAFTALFYRIYRWMQPALFFKSMDVASTFL
jgi:hypothetical protein